MQLILERAAPGEVEKGELVEEVALPTDELRDALAWLIENHEIEETDAGYRSLREGAEPEVSAAGKDKPEREEEHVDEEPTGPGLDAHVRASYTLVGSFPRSPDEDDERSLAKAQHLATQIGNVMSRALQGVSFHVEVANVEVFDRARPLWPPPRQE